MAKREAIVAAALELFEDRGYDATPVPAIAERAGVAVGTIYRSFPSKDALVNDLYRQGKARMAASLPPADEWRRLAPREGFHRWWGGLWHFASTEPRWFAFLETHHHAAYLDDESRMAGAALDDAAAAFVRHGQRAGAIRPGPPAELVALAFGAFVGLARAGLLDRRRRAAAEAAVWSLLAFPQPSST